MKKIIIILSMFLILCGCSKSEDSVVKKFKQKIEKSNSYILKGTMSINSNEDTFNYGVEASKSKDDYYKVSLINKTNDHEQIILKNKDGVFVVTPELNKSFKFQSDWPNNGSQSYLLDMLVNDVANDDNIYVGKDDKSNYIQCRVNYPNNNTLYSEKIYLDDDYGVKRVEVLDQDGKVKITLKVTSIDYNAKFDKDYFSLDKLITQEETNTKEIKEKEKTTTTKVAENNKNEVSEESNEGTNENNAQENNTNEQTEQNENEQNTSNILKDIIYPLYIPENTHLKTEDTISTDDGNRAILTFSGDSPFILIEEVSKYYDELEIIPVNGDPFLMNDTIGAISTNSLYWTSNGIDYYLSSNTMDSNELITIAEGLTGTSIIVSSEK